MTVKKNVFPFQRKIFREMKKNVTFCIKQMKNYGKYQGLCNMCKKRIKMLVITRTSPTAKTDSVCRSQDASNTVNLTNYANRVLILYK